jgi:PEP-CTERM motif
LGLALFQGLDAAHFGSMYTWFIRKAPQMKRIWLKMVALALPVFLMGGGAARADYVFLFTGNTPNFLRVTTTTGTVILSTATNEFFGVPNQGWWSPTASNGNANSNFATGTAGLFAPDSRNDFFTFATTGLAGKVITGVTLDIQNSGTSFTGDSGASGDTYKVYDVSTSAAQLNTLQNNPNAAIYNDLGSGSFYGSVFVPSASNGAEYLITLDSAAIADLQAAVNSQASYFSTGGTIVPGNVQTNTTPEPASFAMLGLGALVLGYARRRQKMAASV